jgi:hypothetical protein
LGFSSSSGNPTLRHMIRSLLPACVLLVAAIGCASKNTAQTRPTAAREDSPFRHPGPAIAPAQNAPVLLASGPSPLAYLFSGGGGIRIVDATAHNTLMTATPTANSLISINARSGITIAGQKLVRGPLPGDHTYEIWFEPKPR